MGDLFSLYKIKILIERMKKKQIKKKKQKKRYYIMKDYSIK